MRWEPTGRLRMCQRPLRNSVPGTAWGGCEQWLQQEFVLVSDNWAVQPGEAEIEWRDVPVWAVPVEEGPKQ